MLALSPGPSARKGLGTRLGQMSGCHSLLDFLSDGPGCGRVLERRARNDNVKMDRHGDLMVFVSCILSEFLRSENGKISPAPSLSLHGQVASCISMTISSQV